MTAPLPGVPSGEPDEPDGSTIDGLIFLIERQRDLITAIATGTSIDGVRNNDYRERRRKIRAGLAPLSVPDPYPWADLNEWWAFCAAPRFTTYRARRSHVSEITEPVLDELERRKSPVTDWQLEETTETWATVETRLVGLKSRLDSSISLDDWQDVGRRAREVLIAATNVVFHDSMMADGVDAPQAGNAKARFDAVVDTLAEGASNDALRRLMKSAWDLAQKVTHSDGITRVDAFASVQSTVAIVRTLQEIERALA